jgi:hypothetical protein
MNSYFEATHSRMAISITHQLEHLGLGVYPTIWQWLKIYGGMCQYFQQQDKNEYSSYEEESIVVVWDVSSFQCYFYGSPFILVTSH